MMTEAANSKTSEKALKWGPIQLLPGVGRGNMTVYVLGFVFTMLFSTFVPQAQPFILTEVLSIPQSAQGEISGYLGFAATLMGLLLSGVWGTLSDKTGRRTVYAIGLFLSAVGIFIFPLAGTIVLLYLARMVFASGSNASNTMSNALLADYIDNKDRGKAFGITASFGGIGALLTVFFFLRLPAMLERSGMATLQAGKITYWIVAGLSLIGMVLIWTGLLAKSSSLEDEKRGFLEIARDALKAARQDPAISLAYGVNFVSTGALTVAGTFFALWIVTYGTTQGGLSSADALARAGMILGMSQMMGLVAAPMFGILADKVKRTLAVAIATGLIAVIFALTLLIKNPLSGMMIALGLFIGFVQTSGVVTGGALIAQQSPEDVRGSVMGFYGFCGALGTMLTSLAGGWLFDGWLYQGPFVFIGILCAVIAIWGFIVSRRAD
jgi:MFS family permease